MDIADAYRDLEKLVLRRDELLNKLRKEIEDLEGVSNYDVMKLENILRRLRRSRRNLLKILNNFRLSDFSSSFSDLVKTLAQFSLLVAVNDEEELLKEVINVVKGKGGKVISELEQDIREVRELRNTLSNFLSSE